MYLTDKNFEYEVIKFDSKIQKNQDFSEKNLNYVLKNETFIGKNWNKSQW